MNKLVKGSIAGAAGIALLLGGAGTLALWNDSAAITGVAVGSGTLSLEATNASWMGASTAMVPGDTVTYTSDLTIKAVGTTLKSQLSVNKGSIVATTGNEELKAALVVSVAVVGALPTGITANPDGTFEVAANSGDITLPMKVTITLPSTVGDAAGEGELAQSQGVNVSGMSFDLKQYIPTP